MALNPLNPVLSYDEGRAIGNPYAAPTSVPGGFATLPLSKGSSAVPPSWLNEGRAIGNPYAPVSPSTGWSPPAGSPWNQGTAIGNPFFPTSRTGGGFTGGNPRPWGSGLTGQYPWGTPSPYAASGGQNWPSMSNPYASSGGQSWPMQGGWTGQQQLPTSLYSSLLQYLLQNWGAGAGGLGPGLRAS